MERDSCKDPGMDGRMILKLFLKDHDGGMERLCWGTGKKQELGLL
jgi:hypothetical protein